jgi:hypothetical protein
MKIGIKLTQGNGENEEGSFSAENLVVQKVPARKG